MAGTYFFYTLLMAFMILLSMPSVRANVLNYDRPTLSVPYWGPNLILLVLLYAIIIGCRYYVGIDYEAYLEWYEILNVTGIYPRDIEFGYEFLNQVLHKVNAHFAFLFIFIAFFQVFFIYKALEKFPFIIPWYLFFFFTYLLMFSSMNIMRQTLAYFVFFYAMNLAIEKRYFLALVCCIFGFSFHTTIVIPIAIFPFLFFDWFKNKYVQIGLILFVSAFASQVLTYGLMLVSPVVTMLGYGYYVENLDYMYEISEKGNVGAGTARILFFILDMVVIWYSPNLKEIFKPYHFYKYYNLYFLGAFLERIVYNNFILARTNDYLLNFRVLILSFLCFYLVNSSSNRQLKLFITGIISVMMLAYFYRAIYNSAAQTSPFRFLLFE